MYFSIGRAECLPPQLRPQSIYELVINLCTGQVNLLGCKSNYKLVMNLCTGQVYLLGCKSIHQLVMNLYTGQVDLIGCKSLYISWLDSKISRLRPLKGTVCTYGTAGIM